MITQAEFFGNAQKSSAAIIQLYKNSERLTVIRSSPGVGDHKVTFPDARKLENGGPVFVIANDDGGGQSYEILDNSLNQLIATLADGKVAVFYLVSNATQAGTWIWREYDIA